MSLNSVWRSVVRVAKKIRDNVAHNYPKLPASTLGEDKLPFRIGRNVSIIDYNTFLDRKESTKFKFHWENRSVFIVAIPNPVHEAVVNMLQDYFKIPNGGVMFDPPINVLGAPFHCDPSDNTHALKLAADVTVRPDVAHLTNTINMRHPGPPPCDVEQNPHGRIFCEVAYYEDLTFLHNKCTNWMLEGYVRYVLGIKIYEKRKGSNNRTMTARLYSRVAATVGPTSIAVGGLFYQEWDFGTVQFGNNLATRCVTPGNNSYLVTIPVSEVFWDPPIGVSIGGYVAAVPGTATVTAPNFVIDLYRIQQEVIKNSQ